MTIQIFHHPLRIIRLTSFLLLLLLAAILTGLRFWILPRTERLRHDLEIELSRRLNQPVRIRHLRTRLYGFAPQLRLIDVTVGLHHQLRLKEIQLTIDVPASVRHQHLQPAQLRIIQAHIELQPAPKGGFRIAGLGEGGGKGAPPWLLADGRFELLHSTLAWRSTPEAQPVTWRDVSIRLDNHDKQHHLQMRFRSPHEWGKQIFLSAVFQEGPGHSGPWQGRFLIHLDRLHLSPFAAALLETRLQGRGNMRLWGEWHGEDWEIHGDIDLHGFTWASPSLRRPLQLQHLSGRIHLNKSPRGWQLETDSLRLTNTDFDIRTRLKLFHPYGAPPHLESLTQVARLDMTHLSTYLPRDTPDNLTGWLEKAPLQGNVHGLLLWRGRAVDFPFRDQSGTSEAQLLSPHAVIHFHPAWPPLSGAVELRFHNGHTSIKMDGARFGKVPVHSLQAQLDFPASDPVLEIQGHTPVHPDQVLKTLAYSPLQSSIHVLERWIRIQGKAGLSMKISVPLKHVDDYQIQGRARIREGRIQSRSQPLSLEHLAGRLHFSQRQLQAEMKGHFLEQPAYLKIQATPDQTDASVRTRVTAASLPGQAKIPWLKGSTEATFHLLVPHEVIHPPILKVQSNLRGLDVDLPPPLEKSASLKRPFRLTIWLTADHAVPVSVEYADIHAALTVDKTTHHVSGRIGIHQPPPPPWHGPNGLVLAGHLDRLPLIPWLRRRQSLPPRGIFTLRRLDLIIDHLLLDAKDLGRHQIRLTHGGSQWEGKLAAPYTKGKWSFSDYGLRIDLSFFEITGLQTILSPAIAESSPLGPEVPRFPLRISCRKLHWEGRNLGRLDLRMLPHPSTGIRFDLRMEGDAHLLEGSGKWQQGTQPATHFEGRFQSRDLSRFLADIGHPTPLADTPARIDFQLLWPNAPHRVTPHALHGHLTLHLGSGRWLALEPGAGRILGLLYLGTLERRLRLDFSDLFASGLSYDRISGHIHLAGGRAFTDDLVIEAVPARIFISGTADLISRQVNEYLTVIPNTPLTLGLFSHNRPYSASLLQKLFNTPLDTITQSQYAIYGPWDDPAIIRLHRSLPGALWGGIWSGLKELVHE